MGIKPQVHRSRTAGAQVKPRVGGPKSRNIDGNPLGEMLGGDIQHPPIADASSMSRQSDVGKLRPRLSEREMDDVSNEGVPVDEADPHGIVAVSYTHLRAHETGRNLVCRLLLEKKKKKK